MTITLIWPTPEVIGAVHHALCNLSPTATNRIVGSSGTVRTGDIIDTGAILACPWPERELGGLWTPATAASAYAYGGGSHASTWISNVAVRRLDIDLVDDGNRQGYIEVSKLFVGKSWSPLMNVDYDSSLSFPSTGTVFRTRGGGRRSTRGTKSKRLTVPLSNMNEADRGNLVDLLVANGTEDGFIYSQYPNDQSPKRERDFQGYFALADTPAMRRLSSSRNGTELTLESI
ncbi:MAG: hypothetical protein M3Y65_09825 [Pseudomonadota bacterium]|nr:hypothetical protein [Pseudomonadota bacterium]